MFLFFLSELVKYSFSASGTDRLNKYVLNESGAAVAGSDLSPPLCVYKTDVRNTENGNERYEIGVLSLT